MLGIVGSVGAAVGNILHPDVPDGDAAAADLIAGSAIWVPAHLLIAVTVSLMAFGLLAVTCSIGRPRASAWAVFGLVSAMTGVTIGVALMAADGITAKYASVAFIDSQGAASEAALQIAAFAERVSFGLVAMFNIFFGGLTYLFYGIAVALSRRFPAWLGVVIAVIGAGSVVIGCVQAIAGESSPTIELLTVITPSLFTLWTLTMCILLLRRPGRRGAFPLIE